MVILVNASTYCSIFLQQFVYILGELRISILFFSHTENYMTNLVSHIQSWDIKKNLSLFRFPNSCNIIYSTFISCQMHNSPDEFIFVRVTAYIETYVCSLLIKLDSHWGLLQGYLIHILVF